MVFELMVEKPASLSFGLVGLPISSRGFLYLAATQTTGADPDPFGLAIDHGSDTLQVG
jgi:hypothetical protein